MDGVMLKGAMPALPLTGGCQCGAVRLRIRAEPIVFYFCHCRECQRQSASAFGQSLRVRSQDMEIEGTLARTEWVVDSGARRTGKFCPACGVRIFHGSPGEPTRTLKAGTLDDTSWLRPAGHIWMRSAQPWFRPAPGELVYETGPDDGFQALAERWRQIHDLPAPPASESNCGKWTG